MEFPPLPDGPRPPMLEPPRVMDALGCPDAVAAFAVEQGPRVDVLAALLMACASPRLSQDGELDAVAALEAVRTQLEAVQLGLAGAAG